MKHKIIKVTPILLDSGQVAKIEEGTKTYFISYAVNVNLSKNRDETAIVVRNKYYIINGNHMEQYSRLTKKEQIKYFLEKAKDGVGFWSESPNNLK